MRIIIVGAGAIGGSLAAELARSSAEVIVVARGSHGHKIAAKGLHYRTPHVDCFVPLQVVHAIEELEVAADDVAILTTKLGDCEEALSALAKLDSTLPILCLQNGVAAEAMAAEHMQHVYGGMVYLPSTYLRPGTVDNYCSNGPGAIRMGPYQGGVHPRCEALAGVLADAGFNAESVAPVMPWKYGKLLTNLGNALEVASSDWDNARPLYMRALAEGEACFEAAGIAYVSVDELVAAASVELDSIGGERRPGGSMWQSVARGRSVEVEYLNGAIVALGEAHGVPTPINEMLVSSALQTARDGTRWTIHELTARI